MVVESAKSIACFSFFADTAPVSTNVITTQVQSNVTTVVCNITNTRTSSAVTAGPSQISTTAIGSNPASTPSGLTVGVPVPVSSSIPQNSSVLTVAAHDAANAPTVGSPGSSFLATSAITTPSQVFSVTSTATTSSGRPRMSSRPAQSEAASLAPTNECKCIETVIFLYTKNQTIIVTLKKLVFMFHTFQQTATCFTVHLRIYVQWK